MHNGRIGQPTGQEMARKAEQTTIVSYKGLDHDFKCRGHQFEVGKTYKVSGEIKACENGFHACENPFDVWMYYPVISDTGKLSRYALTEQSGATDRHDADSKIASAEITIKAELKLPEFIQRGVAAILAAVDFSNAPATNTGNYSAATNTGYQSAATVEGNDSVALAGGHGGRVAGAMGCALFLVERDDDHKIIAAWGGIVGRDGIKPSVFYTLKGGKIVEVDQ